MSGVLNGVFWFLVLFLISFFVAGICFVPYIIVSVFTPCCSGCQGISDILLAGVNFPHMCSENMVGCKDCC